MSIAQHPCSSLKWDEEFQLLLKELSVAIHEASGKHKTALARYQTAIALGGYLGTRAKELMGFRWFDVVGKTSKDLYEPKTEKYRKIFFNEKLLKLVSANYQIVDPINIHDYILESPSNPSKPITTRAFNKKFRSLINKVGITTDNPSSHTLRKTFGMRIFKNRGADEEALIFVSEVYDHSSPAYTRTYLGIRKNQIRQAYLQIH